eukprot:jgi/Phyca11/552701/estExt2_Genewise1Plus.C_PHYCAscaffold_490070
MATSRTFNPFAEERLAKGLTLHKCPAPSLTSDNHHSAGGFFSARSLRYSRGEDVAPAWVDLAVKASFPKMLAGPRTTTMPPSSLQLLRHETRNPASAEAARGLGSRRRPALQMRAKLEVVAETCCRRQQ